MPPCLRGEIFWGAGSRCVSSARHAHAHRRAGPGAPLPVAGAPAAPSADRPADAGAAAWRGWPQRRGLGSLWIKRDDVSGPLYGGNKPRKLEWLLGAARAARAARRDHLRRHRHASRPGDGDLRPRRRPAHRAGAAAAAGDRPRPALPAARSGRRRRAASRRLRRRRRRQRAAPAAPPPLLRGRPLAIVPDRRHVGARRHRLRQRRLRARRAGAGRAPCRSPTRSSSPLGSGGTVAGLALGCRLAGLRSRVVAVLVTDILPPSPAACVGLARGALRRLRARRAGGAAGRPCSPTTSPSCATISAPPTAPSPTPASRRSACCSRTEGIELETTYTAKCMAALLDLAARPPYRDQTAAVLEYLQLGRRRRRASARCRTGARCRRHFIASSPARLGDPATAR